MNRRWIALVALAAVVILGAAFVVKLFAPSEDRSSVMRLSSMRAERNRVAAADQKPSGVVRLRLAALAAPGFVAIQADEDGPGTVIGNSHFLPAGEFRDLVIPLASPPLAGYHFAVIYVDDGDERFEPDEDFVAGDERGGGALVRFLIAEDAPEP